MIASLAAAASWLVANPGTFARALGDHLLLSVTGFAIGVAIALPVGLLVARRSATAEVAITTAGLLRTLPSLAVLAALLPLLGVGFSPSVAALALIALPPVLVNTVIGLRGVDAEALDAATGLGLTRAQRLRQVELPLAAPLIFSGLRIAAVQVVSGAALATFIGGGGLGDLVTQGVALLETGRLLVGAITIAALALALEFGLGRVERAVALRSGSVAGSGVA